MPVNSTSKTRWEDQVKARYMLDPATGLPTLGASTPLEATLPGMEYLGGTSFTLDGSLPKWLTPSPGATTVRITANGGEVHYEINGVSANALSPGYVPDGQSETIGPICNMSAMWFFSATADTTVHVSYWRREGTALAGAWVEPDYWQRVMATDPIAYWPLWETAGTVAHCLVNPAQNGTYSSDVSTWPVGAGIGDGNSAPILDGANDDVNVQSVPLVAAFDGSQGTASIWVRVSGAGIWTDGTVRELMAFVVNGTNLFLMRRAIADNRILGIYIAGGVTDQAIVDGLSTTDWMHFALVWDKTNEIVSIYNDGAFVASSATLGVWAGNLATAYIGSQATASRWSGGEAHCVIHDRALSGPEIAALATV